MILIALLLVSFTTAAQLPDKPYYDLENAHVLFKEYLKEHNKVYNPDEYLKRLEIFKASLKDINERNAEFPKTVFEVNYFADLTEEEMQQYKGFRQISDDMFSEVELPFESITAPDNFDWRDHGVVTPVKNQGSCGSCYVFSAIGNIEGQYAIKYNQTLAFSEQQSVDCMTLDPEVRHTCDGGFPHEVFFYHATEFGNILEKDYPYVGKSEKCHAKEDLVKTNITSFTFFRPNEETLKKMLYTIGPLSVALDAADMDRYKGGILYPKYCSDDIDHAVLLVGYGVEDDDEYWIIKNSWGKSWGDNGYFKLLRGVNACNMGTSYTATSVVA